MAEYIVVEAGAGVNIFDARPALDVLFARPVDAHGAIVALGLRRVQVVAVEDEGRRWLTHQENWEMVRDTVESRPATARERH